MAVTAEQLNIILAARDREFASAMERNTRRIEQFGRRASKNLNATSKAFDGLGVIAKRIAPPLAAAFSIQATRGALELTSELDNLAAVAGLDVVRFQELAFATQQFGIQQDKLSDILKDVNDKFGDYAQTGAGPLADFFDNIAPKIGITATQFESLSSEQKLGAYIAALEAANVSQADMTFYLEALASDATLLQRAFANNGAVIDEMATKARDAGLILDEEMIAKAKEAKQELDLMSKTISSNLTIALNNISPLLVTATGALADLTEIAKSFGNAFGKSLNLAMAAFDAELKARGQKPLFNQVLGIEYDIEEPPPITEPGNLPPVVDMGTVGGTGPFSPALAAALDRTKTFLENYDGKVKKTKDSTDKLSGATREYELQLAAVEKRLGEIGISMNEFEDLSSSITSSLEQSFMAMVDGTMSTKEAFKSMARDVIRDLYRVLVVQRLVAGITGFATSALGIPALPAAASGGTVQAGSPVITGEHGREIFVPRQDGRVMSAAQTREIMSGGEGIVVNQTINVSTGVQQTVRSEIMTMLPMLADNAKAAVLDAKRRGGSYGRAMA